MRRILPRLVALSLVVVLLFAPTAGAQGKTVTVNIKNFAFNPPNTPVAPGTTVTWVNNDQTTHTVTANNGAFNSGNLPPGQTFSQTFTTAGTYAYHCNIHPFMTGTVTVSGAASASASAMASSPSASASTQLASSGGPSLLWLAAPVLVAASGVIALVLLVRRVAS
jgi:plastocyanin